MKVLMLLAAVSLVSAHAWANEEAAKQPAQSEAAQAINSACASDAQTAGCGSQKVGTGLIKCLHAYKKSQGNEFHFSDSCKAAMHAGSDERREKRAERKEKRAERKEKRAEKKANKGSDHN